MTDTRQASTLELNAMAAAEAMAWLTEHTKPRPTDKALPRIAHLEARIQEHRAGPWAQATDGGGHGGGERPDPTFAASQTEDVAAKDLDDVRSMMRHVRVLVLAIDAIAQRHLRTVAVPASTEEDGCAWCQRVDVWSEVYVATTGERWLEHPLANDTDLCQPCYRRLKTTNAVPSNSDLAEFHRVGKWPKRPAKVAA